MTQPALLQHLMLHAATANLRAAALELREVASPPVQVRDAIKRVDDALAALDNLRTEPEIITLAMLNAGYDATRLTDGTPQFASAGYVLGSSATIYAAMRAAAAEPSPVAVTFTMQAAS